MKILILIASIALFPACKKEDIKPMPTPTPTVAPGSFSLAITAPMSGEITGPTTTAYFSSSDASITLSCKVDGSPVACSLSGLSLNLPQGMHTLQITGTNGSSATQSASVDWQVDAQGPMMQITYPMNGASTSSSVTITFTSGDSISNQCTLDSSAVPCGNNATFINLSSGPHTFTVSGVDQFGNTGAAASVSWTVTP